jgi:hypothetical protein
MTMDRCIVMRVSERDEQKCGQTDTSCFLSVACVVCGVLLCTEASSELFFASSSELLTRT